MCSATIAQVRYWVFSSWTFYSTNNIAFVNVNYPKKRLFHYNLVNNWKYPNTTVYIAYTKIVIIGRQQKSGLTRSSVASKTEKFRKFLYLKTDFSIVFVILIWEHKRYNWVGSIFGRGPPSTPFKGNNKESHRIAHNNIGYL